MRTREMVLTVVGAVLAAGAASAPAVASPPRIVGGQAAPAVSFMAQIFDVRPGAGDVFQCGGTVVAPQWVLTARHCVADAGETTAVRVGSATLGAGSRVAVDRAVVPPGAGDVALLRLTSASAVVPVTLATASSPFEGAGVLYGWGAERAGDPPVMSTALKQATTQVYSDENPDGDGGPGLSSWSLGETGAAYRGDSGGPLIVRGRQVGVISTVVGAASASGFNDHARVAAHRSWIRGVIGR